MTEISFSDTHALQFDGPCWLPNPLEPVGHDEHLFRELERITPEVGYRTGAPNPAAPAVKEAVADR